MNQNQYKSLYEEQKAFKEHIMSYSNGYYYKNEQKMKEFLENSSLEFKSDKKFIVDNFDSSFRGHIYPLVAENLKNDKEFILFSYNKSIETINDLPENLKKDKELLKILIKENPLGFNLLDESIKKDKNYIEELVKANGQVFSLLDDEFKTPELAKVAIETDLLYKDDLKNVYRGFSSEMRNNKELAFKAIDKNPMNVMYCSEALRDDFEIGKYVVNKKGYAFKYLSENLKSKKEIAFIAVGKDTLCLYELNSKLLNDVDIAIASLKNDPTSYTNLGKKLVKTLEANNKSSNQYLTYMQDHYEELKVKFDAEKENILDKVKGLRNIFSNEKTNDNKLKF